MKFPIFSQDHIKNIFGFNTKRKIVVIESDDWGSIRTKDLKAYENMLQGGLNVDENTYTKFDTLESEKDIEDLFSVLSSHKDSTGRYPVITPMYNMGNPDFEKIDNCGFQKYFFESIDHTYKKYNYNNVLKLLKDGIENRLFVPALHGREHLNAPRWMRLLQKENPGILLSFKNQSIGADRFKNKMIPKYLEAFDPEFPEDEVEINQSLVDSVLIFKDLFGYAPEHFIEPNTFGRIELEKVLHEQGIKYLLRGKITKYSEFNDMKKMSRFHWVGKKNKFGQLYLTRNCTFEPHRPLNLTNVVESCLNEISNSFQWNKPALIISHRASYVSGISIKNQNNGIKLLDELLGQIIKKWPDVEFMTSMELGNLILKSKSK